MNVYLKEKIGNLDLFTRRKADYNGEFMEIAIVDTGGSSE